MSEKPNLLEVIPSRELVFVGTFTNVNKADLTLRNTTSNLVCFKVRTTAPKQYYVRPNAGTLKPGESKKLTVLLQPLKGPPPGAGRHKFMVQSCAAPPEYFVDGEEFWRAVDPTDITSNKLTVTFVDSGNSEDEESSASSFRELGPEENEELKKKVVGLENLIGVMLKKNPEKEQTISFGFSIARPFAIFFVGYLIGYLLPKLFEWIFGFSLA